MVKCDLNMYFRGFVRYLGGAFQKKVCSFISAESKQTYDGLY